MANTQRRTAGKKSHPGNPYNVDVVDREEFWKGQIASLSKALAAAEVPCKEKHIRSLILGSHQERGCGTFWSCVHRIQIESSRFVSWKFCYIFHKLCRDGHAAVLVDSVKYKSKLTELGRLWSHLQSDVYGPMICQYAKLLNTKLMFHANNRSIGGNLQLTDAQIAALGEHDVNNWFELAIEMLDYLDDILELQRMVFDSMDLSRSNSLTAAGQCRLAPLIPCLIDSSCLYDYVVKMLFKLHGVLPADTLSGHRQRFNAIFLQLKKFYSTCRAMQYFKYLVTIPNLPDSAPNLLSASAFDAYIPMHAEALDGEDTASVADSVLVDLMDSRVPSPEPMPPVALAVNDAEVHALRAELDAVRRHVDEQRGAHEQTTHMYDTRLQQMNAQLQMTMEERDNAVHQQASMQRATADATVNMSQLTEAQKLAASQEERYRKMREVYMKVRAEHIETLTKLGELQKQLVDAAADATTMRGERARLDEQMQTSATSASTETTALRSRLDALSAAAVTNNLELLASVCTACANNARDTGEQFDNAAHLGVMCPPEYAMSRLIALRDAVGTLCTAIDAVVTGDDADDGRVAQLQQVIARLIEVNGKSCDTFIHAYAVAHQASTDVANQLSQLSRDTNQSAVHVFTTMAMRGQWTSTLPTAVQAFDALLTDMSDMLQSAMGTFEDVNAASSIESLIDEQMATMNAAIAAAADRIEAIRSKSRQHDQGVKLELHADILDQCTTLMTAVQELVRRAKHLQAEIVEQGRGAGSPHEFYKRNHKWTEGLLSAAKSIGLAAHVLVDTADGVVTGTGKLESLMVASREVAASTAQLVVASNVKADRQSVKLSDMTAASKVLTQATAAVIASVKAAQSTIDERQYDFSHLTMHQAKQDEFDTQVRVMSLETELVNERRRLGELRRKNYRDGEEVVERANGGAQL